MGKQGVFIFIALIAIIAGLSMVVYGNMRQSDTVPSYNTTTTIPETPSANNLIVPDQKAGSVVTVSEADLMQTGFVVIKDARNSGKTLGTSVILSASKNALVFVNAITYKGKTYYAFLYGDNGDGRFTSSDSVLSGASGNPLIISFKAL
jgi:hypothetical protein